MATSLTFGGATTRIPTVRVHVDDAGLIPFNAGDQPIVAVVGVGKGGQPKTPLLFSSPAQAREVIRDGELMTGIEHAFRGGAPLVYGVRVNAATQATVTLDDAASADSIVFTSVNYGTEDNLLAVKVETGTVAATKKVSIRKGTAIYARDSILRELISLQYTGAGSACTLTVTATTLSTTVTGASGEDITLTLANYPTLQDLYDALANTANYTTVLLGTNPDQVVAAKLDTMSGVAIKASAGKITANLEEIIAWVNLVQPHMTAARATNAGAVPANTTGWVNLAGASEGASAADDWQAAIDALEPVPVTFIAPMTADATLHQKVLTHVKAVSNDGTKPRLGFVGAATGEKTSDLSNYLVRARGLNSDRMALVPNGVVRKNDDGSFTTFPPYMMAALVAGMQAGVTEIGTSITNAGLGADGLEWTPSRADLELGISGGLLMVMQDPVSGGYKIARAITTWLQNHAYHRVELSTRIALDEVVVRVINGLGIYIGQKADPLTAYRAVSTVQTILNGLREQRIIADYNSLEGTVEINGDTLKVKFAVMPIISINFVAVTLYADTYKGTFQLATA